MDQRSVIIGFVAGLVVVAGGMGAAWAFEELQGPEITDVSVTRLNATHAAIAWSSEEPTYGYLVAAVYQQSNGTLIHSRNDSAVTRTHLAVAPIYELNRSRLAQSNMSENGSPRIYEARVEAWEKKLSEGGSDPDFATLVECTLNPDQQNRSDGTHEQQGSVASCQTVL